MNKYVLLGCLLMFHGLGSSLNAHDYPIYPVEVKLKVQPERITAKVKNNAVYWVSELLSSTRPLADQWPESTRKGAENLLNQYMRIDSDGRLLPGTLGTARYVAEPFKEDKSYVLFEMTYSLPAGAQTVSGTMEFFKPYWEHETMAHGRHAHLNDMPDEPNKIFQTHLSFVGHPDSAISLPIEKPEFSFAVASRLTPPKEYIRESLIKGFFEPHSGVWFAAFILAALLALPSRPSLLWGIVLSISASLLGFYLFPALGNGLRPMIPALAVMLLSSAAMFPLPKAAWFLALSTGSILWGQQWKSEFLASFHQLWVFYSTSYLAGKFVFFLLTAGIVLLTFWAYRKRQSFLSESMAPEIAKTHARFASAFLFVMALLKLGNLILR